MQSERLYPAKRQVVFHAIETLLLRIKAFVADALARRILAEVKMCVEEVYAIDLITCTLDKCLALLQILNFYHTYESSFLPS